MNQLTSRWSAFPGIILLFACLLCLLCLSTLGRAAALENTVRLQSDLRFLEQKLAAHQDEIKAGADGEKHLAEFNEQLNKLRAFADQLTTAASELDAKDSRLNYLKEVELTPRANEVERARQNLDQRYADAERARQSFEQEVQAHNSRPHQFDIYEQSGASAAYNQEKMNLDSRASMLRSSMEMAIAEARRTLDTAMTSYNYSQQQFNDVRTQREQIAQRLQEVSGAYARSRESLVTQLTVLEKDSSATPAPAQPPSANADTSQDKPAASSGKEAPPVENSGKK